MPAIRIAQEHWGKVWRALVAVGPVARVSQEPVYQVGEEQVRLLRRHKLPFQFVAEANGRQADQDHGPGSIEQREFEYTRHGTVNLLLFLVVHTGRMEVAVEAAKDAKHYIGELKPRHTAPAMAGDSHSYLSAAAANPPPIEATPVSTWTTSTTPLVQASS